MPKILTNAKDDIIQVTRRLLAEIGYEPMNIRMIAEQCGIGMGTIYNYFKSKDEIVVEIVLKDWDIMLRRMDILVQGEQEPHDKLEGIFNLVRSFVRGYHGTWIEMALGGMKNPEVCHSISYRKQLADLVGKVMDPITPQHGTETRLFLNDLVARTFLSYSYEEDVDYARMRIFIDCLLFPIAQPHGEQVERMKAGKGKAVGSSGRKCPVARS